MSSNAWRCHTAMPGVYQLQNGRLMRLPPNLDTIVRSLTTYRPLAVLGRLGLLFILAGGAILLIPLTNWIAQGHTGGHLQSLIAAAVLGLVGLQLLVLGLLADTVSANRRITEEVLYLLKAERVGESAAIPPFEPIQERAGTTVPEGLKVASQAASDRTVPITNPTADVAHR